MRIGQLWLSLLSLLAVSISTGAESCQPESCQRVCKNALITPATRTSAPQSATELSKSDEMKLKADLLSSEGMRLKPYRDTTGNLTIGVGHNLDSDGITQEEADYIFEDDMEKVLHELDKFPQYQNMRDDVRSMVIDEMAFNMGVNKVMKFKAMWEAIGNKDWEGAADAMLDSRWARQVGTRAIRLANVMRSGKGG